jgi:hypothetical protein
MAGRVEFRRLPGEAELAFEVPHEHRRRGLATLLLERFACVAGSVRILRFTGHPGSAQQPIRDIRRSAVLPASSPATPVLATAHRVMPPPPSRARRFGSHDTSAAAS